MTAAQRELLDVVRAKHQPYFAELERLIRAQAPRLSEWEVAGAVCTLVELVDAEEMETLEDCNPGLRRIQ